MPESTLGGDSHIGVSSLLAVSMLEDYCANILSVTGWAKYMEWMYPVEVRFTNKGAFRLAGAVEAAATL
jgi:hypothetical protein